MFGSFAVPTNLQCPYSDDTPHHTRAHAHAHAADTIRGCVSTPSFVVGRLSMKCYHSPLLFCTNIPTAKALDSSSANSDNTPSAYNATRMIKDNRQTQMEKHVLVVFASRLVEFCFVWWDRLMNRVLCTVTLKGQSLCSCFYDNTSLNFALS